MIKTHNVTGLKYLCYTCAEGDRYRKYTGSGIKWLDHLSKHGDDITTELIFETEDKSTLVSYARQKSIEWNIVESDEWANLKLEEGDGGDTVSNRMWITDGSKDVYIYKNDVIPEGWKRGRSQCVFNDKNTQAKLSARVDRKKNGLSIKKAWVEGKFANRITGVKGDANPSKRLDVRSKIRKTAKQNWSDGLYKNRVEYDRRGDRNPNSKYRRALRERESQNQ